MASGSFRDEDGSRTQRRVKAKLEAPSRSPRELRQGGGQGGEACPRPRYPTNYSVTSYVWRAAEASARCVCDGLLVLYSQPCSGRRCHGGRMGSIDGLIRIGV